MFGFGKEARNQRIATAIVSNALMGSIERYQNGSVTKDRAATLVDEIMLNSGNAKIRKLMGSRTPILSPIGIAIEGMYHRVRQLNDCSEEQKFVLLSLIELMIACDSDGMPINDYDREMILICRGDFSRDGSHP
jgi:hypothetical protein